ncbi:DoxX family protein [Paraburkholderia caffeinilytica]|uniref:DoxX family protein n=1 Tax=Paraburkholderia caffeinilytica TaxID=1761016 RepID=UPI0038B92EA0
MNLSARLAQSIIPRIFLSLLFIYSGVGKLLAVDSTMNFISANGVPFPAIAFSVALVMELIVSTLVIVGYQLRFSAGSLAIYSIATALMFHHGLSNQLQAIQFLKDVAIAGGFLQLAASKACFPTAVNEHGPQRATS